MRKTTIFTLTLLSLAILPVMAQQDQTLVGQVWSDFQSYSRDLQDYFQYRNVNENLNPESDGQNAISATSNEGELKIPNPVAAGQKVRDNVNYYSYRSQSKASRFENNAAVRGNLASNELNRLMTRGIAVGVLGKNAQSRTKGKLENIQDELFGNLNDGGSTPPPPTNCTGDPVQKQACDAVVALTTTLLNLNNETIQMQKLQAKIVAETFVQSIQTNQSLQYSNLNLANISQQAEEANRARRVDTSTETARLLRATSQLDLFGKEKIGNEDLRIKRSITIRTKINF
ncbi:hypothetical protein NIES4072_55890 [Nostoc commune NIES-4072]|uniref:Uncharacterized protein n=1 Tax=Nostoc commune NIES-4072 TaxID=2005467 RepID=A0A2R5FT27_NOSCO|nr:hypothetical protein [Nostoc commune]BBD67116.1 hypothetical protein NIES4070_35040 [Nostoc commune HK-02]GBG21900.1 hypothetical protein NIES4072_55890 [Nostoc commune NIES-4072]